MSFTAPIADSDLFRQVVKRKTLKHPTAAAFDVAAWAAAAAALQPPSFRDANLLCSALRFGVSLSDLRTHIDANLATPFSRAGGIRLLAAVANEQYVVLTRKMARANRRLSKRAEQPHMEMFGQNLVQSGVGQRMTADDHVTQLIDTLPHWLHHIWQLPADKTAPEPSEPWDLGMRALMTASVERGLRDLWHSSLWEGYEIVVDDEVEIIQPPNRELAEQWLVWNLREQSLLSWEAISDAAALKVSRGDIPPVIPVSDKTVVAINRKSGRRPDFVVGRANGSSQVQRAHVSERDMLERVYTGIFIDEILPNFSAERLTCRELCRAWWVIADLGKLLMSELGTRNISNREGLASTSCTLRSSDLNAIITRSLGIDENRAASILRLFTLNPPSASELFSESLWHQPLLPADNDRVHLVLAPLFIGNPVRRIERWLEIGGISDQGKVKGRGKPFEAHVRSRVVDKLAANKLLFDVGALPHGLKRQGESEEIDLLFRIGTVVVVGEVKCFTAPVEPNDRFNYLLALEDAAEQAGRKRDWALANREQILNVLGVTDAQQIARTRFVPLVILNQSFGIGLEIGGVPFTDLHFLQLLIGAGRYQAETRFQPGQMAGAMITMYRSQSQLESSIAKILADPPPLRRYKGVIDWTLEPFPVRGKRPFFIAVPRLGGMPVNKGAIDAITAVAGPPAP